MVSPRIPLINVLKKHSNTYHPVVPFNSTKDVLKVLNFTASNTELLPEIVNNTDAFCEYINNQLQAATALYGIGGYNEHRTVYARSQVFDTAGEPRRLHLGVDIWGQAGTPIFAPMDGTVHSVAFNNRHGDYGATIILQHQLDGFVFHTLYGHLSLASLTGLLTGKRVAAGSQIASFGVPKENGNWPPHLHFQVINNMEGMEGDYPGVCKFSERERYLTNCPNPDIILGMLQYCSVG